jgi:hypothetical protein
MSYVDQKHSESGLAPLMVSSYPFRQNKLVIFLHILILMYSVNQVGLKPYWFITLQTLSVAGYRT